MARWLHEYGRLMALPALTLVLGGARSGKSMYAESLIEAEGEGIYLATAEARDDEMRDRIHRHQMRRSSSWQTIEAPIDLCGALCAGAAAGERPPILVDCLTLWVSNLMAADKEIDQEVSRLIETLRNPKVPVVMVSNEVGLGIVPDNALARRFRDVAGTLNQQIAALANHVVFVAAGLPFVLKDGTSAIDRGRTTG